MNNEQIISERIEQALTTGQVFRPAYEELKFILWVLLVMIAPASVAGVWFIVSQLFGHR